MVCRVARKVTTGRLSIYNERGNKLRWKTETGGIAKHRGALLRNVEHCCAMRDVARQHGELLGNMEQCGTSLGNHEASLGNTPYP